MRKTTVFVIFVLLFLFALICTQAAVSKKIHVPRGTIITLKLPADPSSITNVNAPLSLVVDSDVIVDGEVVIKNGAPATGRVRAAENPVQISVNSSETVDGQNLDLTSNGELRGSKINAYTVSDIRVSVPATSKELRLPRDSMVTFRLPSDPSLITNVNSPLSLVVDSDVVVDGQVVIKRGTSAFGMARMEEGYGTASRKRKVRIIVRSTQAIDRKNVEFGNSDEPMGTRVNAYTAREIEVSVPAVSKELRLPTGTAVTLRLTSDPSLITSVNSPFSLVVDSDVVVDGVVLVKNDTPATGRVRTAESPIQISVISTETIDGQVLELAGNSEPAGSKVNAYTDRDIIVKVP